MTHLPIKRDKPLPKGADLYDFLASGWTAKQVIEWARPRITPWPPPEEPTHESQEMPPVEAYEDESDPDPALPSLEGHFNPLGSNHNTYYYLPYGTRQILSLTPAQHTKNNLMVLAPLAYWERLYNNKRGIDWDAATESLYGRNHRIGYFDHDRIRGRGAWVDEGRQVLHLGTKVYMDGEPIDLADVDSHFVYQGGLDLDIDPKNPATVKDSRQLLEICRQFTWVSPLYGTLLAGWCVIAPVCGILRWRPHIWITGPARSGKTTAMTFIVKGVLNNMAISVDGKTTEAGIRHKLHHDALPVLFDEAEAEDRASIQRMQGILAFARVASSGGHIFKGTTDGKGVGFSVRSCFCFSSINPSVQHYADETRITRLVLRIDTAPNADDRYKELANRMLTILTPTFANRMLARSLKNLRILQHNCDIFVEAVARVLKSRRLADQLGSMLAGAYLCNNDKEISEPEAVAWIEAQDWQEITQPTAKTDEERLIDRIATHRLRLATSSGARDSTIGELIVLIAEDDGLDSGDIKPNEAKSELRRFGIVVENEFFFIANRCDPLKKVLQGTSWASEWGRPLRDLYNAESTDVMYFGPGIRSRATKLPLVVITA